MKPQVICTTLTVICILLFNKINLLAQFSTKPRIVVIHYHDAIHEAEWAVFQGDSAQAIAKYLEAFELICPFLIDLNNAITLVQSLNIRKLEYWNKITNDWLNLRTNIYFPEQQYNDSIHYKNYEWNNLRRPEIIQSRSHFRHQIEAMHDADQNIRKQNFGEKKDSILRVEGENNFTETLRLIEQFGWPRPDLDGYVNVLIYPILMHGTYYCGIDESLDQLMLSEVFNGNLNPHFYAKLWDRYLDWNEVQPQKYGEWQTTLNGNIKISDEYQIDERRRNILLEPYIQFKLKNKILIEK